MNPGFSLRSNPGLKLANAFDVFGMRSIKAKTGNNEFRSVAAHCDGRERTDVLAVRNLANQAFSRAAGAPLVGGNSVRLLIDAKENYPAWFDAIRSAERYIHFESYIIHEDHAGWMFAEALVAKAREGVRVRVLYDWLGGFGKTSRRFWNYLRAGGVEVRCYNPPRLDSPFGWLTRDHRKTLTVDGKIGFVTGLCVGRMWVGVPEKNIEPWRDTGIELRGPAVAEIEYEFARIWAMTGEPLTRDEVARREMIEPAGDVTLRVVGGEPASAELLRVDQLVATLARQRLWLTDAYYAGTFSYVQALRAAAEDGVDVRLLLPSASDWPFLTPLSRSGYRPLLESGIRVFEWNGTMLHAKSAVADCMWARVGSTNLNVVSWFGNFELDVVIEDVPFAREMEETYLRDLENATEIVLDARHKVRLSQPAVHSHPAMTSGGGSGGRVAAGALRFGNAVGAAFSNRRVLEPVEARLMLTTALLLLGFAVLIWFFPRALTYPLIVLLVWIALALVYRAVRYPAHKRPKETSFRPQKSSESAND